VTARDLFRAAFDAAALLLFLTAVLVAALALNP
jgi:hypothetical protein